MYNIMGRYIVPHNEPDHLDHERKK